MAQAPGLSLGLPGGSHGVASLPALWRGLAFAPPMNRAEPGRCSDLVGLLVILGEPRVARGERAAEKGSTHPTEIFRRKVSYFGDAVNNTGQSSPDSTTSSHDAPT